MALDFTEIRALVESGDFRKLVGEIEGQHLDVKSQPYQLQSGSDAKREFAKDVAAFANANGGCIVIGAETAVSALHAGELVTALKPFPGELFSSDQYRKLIAEWIYPLPSGLIINWYPDENTPTSGIGLVFIPAQDSATKPYLIKRAIGDKKTTEILLGYVERHLDRTDVKSVMELHHAMRTGMNLEATLLSRITNLEALLERQLANTSVLQPSSPVPPATTNARVGRILQKPQLNDVRRLVIIVTPAPPSELRSIFSEQPNSIRRALEDPPEFRRNGWGIGAAATARFVEGEFIETDSFRHVDDLYRDGQFIVGSRIDSESLAWADKNHSRIHPLAFVEFVANALAFYRLVLADMRITPHVLRVQMRLGLLTGSGEGTFLPLGDHLKTGHTWSLQNRPTR